MNRIALAYAGVHQIFQLSLAAHEMGELEGLFCSIVDGPGTWGHRLKKWVPSGTRRPLGFDGIPPTKIKEFPWPLIANRLTGKLFPGRQSDHLHSNSWFDRKVARWLESSRASIFVGSETCALHSFKTAGEKGMKCILDCAGIPRQFLDREAQAASKELGLPFSQTVSNPAMAERKRKELDLADVILCCSEFQAEKLAETGANPKKIKTIPLWVDSPFWSACPDRSSVSFERRPLKVIYAGAICLKKGVPYLLKAMQEMGENAQLTMVGKPSSEMLNTLASLPPNCTHQSYVPRDALRQLYGEHDVLVMPSLGDSFGFVIMEAMAAGLPVIASCHAGAPLPSSEWRVPARSSQAIGERLRHYATNRRVLALDSTLAPSFACQWTPERYRDSVKKVYDSLLS